jgi:tetratricopeptide (TPR) repeat protein
MNQAIGRATALALWLSAAWAMPIYANNAAAPVSEVVSLLEQIDAATRAGRLVQAEAMLTWLEQRNLESVSGAIALQRAEFHMAKGELAGAVAALGRAGDHKGNICRYSRLSGWIAGKSAEWNKAILQLAHAVESCGEDASLWNLLGLALVGKGEFTASIEAFDSALILQPDHPGLLNNRALALVRVGKYEEAMADLRRAARVASQDTAIRDNVDYLSGVLGIEPVRGDGDTDAIWAVRLAKTGEGARDADRGGNATAYFANAALLSDRFDAQIWVQGASARDKKAD